MNDEEGSYIDIRPLLGGTVETCERCGEQRTRLRGEAFECPCNNPNYSTNPQWISIRSLLRS